MAPPEQHHLDLSLIGRERGISRRGITESTSAAEMFTAWLTRHGMRWSPTTISCIRSCSYAAAT